MEPMLAARMRIWSIGWAAAVALAGCAPAPPLSLSASPATLTATEPAIASRTPTSTAPSLPTASPTTPVDSARSKGVLLFEARFTSDEGWILSRDADGAASLAGPSLVLAVSRPNASRFVLAPSPTATDFLLEATVRTDLCASEDEIGLLFRVSPAADHYRFTVSCGGAARLTRVVGQRAAVLAGPTQAATVLIGPPIENRLAILARGSALTLFVNDVEVLSARDSTLTSGGFGFFVRSASQGQTTAALTSLHIQTLPPEARITVPPASG